MSHTAIDSEALLKLLNNYTPTQKPNSVDGPLKYFDQEMRCAERGCTSPTHYKIESIPVCTAHALVRLNDMVVDEKS